MQKLPRAKKFLRKFKLHTVLIIFLSLAIFTFAKNTFTKQEILQAYSQNLSTSQISSATTSPTASPKPSPSPEVSIQSAHSPTPQISTSVEDFLIKEVNDFRTSKGKESVQKDPYTCDFAKVRSKEIAINFNHSGFRQRIDRKQLPYPSYSKVAENIANNSRYADVVESWVKSEGHAQNLLLDTTYVCIQNDGNYYAYEGWKP